jgi:hypothetical protein
MTIRIINNPIKDKDLNRNYGDWKQSQSVIVPTEINRQSLVSDQEIDAIANSVPESANQNDIETRKINNSTIPIQLTKEMMAKKMVDDFVKQNGSIIVKEEKKNKLILG